MSHSLLLIGSARRRSTSASLGGYLLERLAEKGFETETLSLPPILKSEEAQAELLAASDRADLVILAAPLYVDCLPYAVIKALEIIAAHRRDRRPPQPQRFLALINCGFPETEHNATAVAICRQFARETGFAWAGGLALGEGGAINGQTLTQVGGMARNAIRALDLGAEALAQGKAVPPEAESLMAKPLVPAWLYVQLGNLNWKRSARRYGTRKQLMAQPYLRQPQL